MSEVSATTITIRKCIYFFLLSQLLLYETHKEKAEMYIVAIFVND
jgi:hypothetical protein